MRLLDTFDDLDVIVIASPPVDRKEGRSVVRFVPVPIARTIKPWSDLKSVWSLWRVLRREKPDVVHSHTSKAGIIAAVAGKLAAIPLVCHTHHGLPFSEEQNTLIDLFYYIIEKIACRFRDYLFSQNARDIPQCIRLMGNKSNVLFENNGVDIEFVRWSADEQFSEATKEYPGEGIRCALLSRLEPVKRVADFLRVVDRLKRKGVAVSCVVGGMGFLEKQLREQVTELRLDDCVNMVGFSDHPHGLIAGSDIVILCSEKEGIPRVLMEAMALGKPVVATDVIGTRELVVDGETGFLVPVGKIDMMAEKIQLLAYDVDMRVKMGAAGQHRVREHYDEKKIVDYLHEFYIREAGRRQ
jgi:glycosyltransferase involved in cell wall biosynthesis